MKRLQLSNPELYNVWKGQLYIREHRACKTTFRSSSFCSIPAQLPRKLNIKEVIYLSALRKALPAQIFDKIHITGQEECCGSVYYTLYAAKTSNVYGFEFDKLQEWMRDRKLALIKRLNDQGFLILLPSSALQYFKDLRVNSFQLYALFLSPHTSLLENTRTEDRGYKVLKGDLSLKVTELLPGLQYAILESTRMHRGHNLFPYVLGDQHYQQFARLQRKNVSAREINAEPSSNSSRFFGHGKDLFDKCDQLAFSRLQSYFSSPVNFAVPLVKMSGLLKEDIPLSSDSEKCNKNLIVKDSIDLESKILLAASKMKNDSEKVLNENKKQPTKKRTFKKGGRRGPRKGSRKKPTQQAASPASATAENQASNKRRKLIGGEEQPQQQPQQPQPPQQPAVSSARMTVKLASAPNTHRRKRGAEVLTAEFVTEDQAETETTATNKRTKEQNTVPKTKTTAGKSRKTAPAEDTVVRDRPPKRKASEPANKNKLPDAKTKSEIIRRAVIKHQEQSKRQTKKSVESITTVPVESVSSLVKTTKDHSSPTKHHSSPTKHHSSPTKHHSSPAKHHSSPTKQPTSPAPVPKSDIIEKRINLYESHALNLLADLALNSFSSSSMSFMNSEDPAPVSEPALQETVSSSDRGEADEDPQNACSSPSRSSTAIEESVQSPDSVKSPSKAGGDASPVNSSSEKQASHKMLLAAAKAKARNNAPSKISLEHSYSQLPRDNMQDKSSKEANEKPLYGASEPTVTSPDGEVMVDKSSDYQFIPREFLLKTGENGSPLSKKEQQDVSKFQENFIITFKWDPKYDFDLDSKFTSDPLEKTINRALHGPWNTHLKEKVEDVKIILHMWLALFYSKPSQQVSSSSRKVVEHSNPAKYVSINTVHDPLYELSEVDDYRNDDERDFTVSENMSRAGWREMRANNEDIQPVDLSVASKTPTKDCNISEMFQMVNQSSVSARFTDSTTVMCKMTSASKVPPPPSYYMKPIICANTPNVCYTDGGKQVNTELNTRSETCVANGGGSSEKVKPRDKKHAYSKHSSGAEKTKRSSDSKKGFGLLPEDSCANEESAEDGEAQLAGAKTPQTPTRGEGMDREHIKSSTFDGTGFSPSKTLTPKPTEEMFSDDDGFSDHSGVDDYFLEDSPLASPVQRMHASPEQPPTALQSTDDRDLTEARLRDVNVDSSVGQSNEDKEPDVANVHLSDTSTNHRDSAVSENKVIESKSSGVEENQTNVTFCNAQDQSLLERRNDDSISGKALESCTEPSHDNLANFETPKTSKTSTSLVCRKISNMDGDHKEQARTDADLLPEHVKEVDSSSATASEVNDKNDSQVKEDNASSCTNEEILGKRSEQVSEEPEKCQKEQSVLAKNDTDETASCGKMGMLQLSSSSSDTSDVEEMEVTNAVKSAPASSKGTEEQKSDSNEEPDVVYVSTEAPVAVSHQDKVRSTKDDGNQINTVTIQPTDDIVEVIETVLTDESLPVRSLTPVSAHLQTKGSEAADRNLESGEVENITEMDKSKDITENTHTFFDQNDIPPVSEEISVEDTKAQSIVIEEQSTANDLESSKAVDLESTVEKTSLLSSEVDVVVDLTSQEDGSELLGSESNKTIDAENQGEKSHLQGSESSKDADLEMVAENRSAQGSESSDSADLECVSVLEKLRLKAIQETNKTPISTLANKQELHIHDKESLPPENKTMGDEPSVDLLQVQTDLSGSVEAEKSLETPQVLCSEAPNKATPLDSGITTNSECVQDSESATNQIVSKCVDGNEDLLLVESQSDSTSDVCLVLSPSRPKTSIQSMKKTIREEILSKLKQICRGAGAGQHTGSNSEDEVFIVHEKPGNMKTGEEANQTDNETGDLSDNDVNTEGPSESTNKSLENQHTLSDVLEEEMEQEIAANLPSVAQSPEPVKEVEKPQSPDKVISPVQDEITENMDQESGKDKSDICCILNTGSISKEQYERLSDSSDDDVEFVRSYTEPIMRKMSVSSLKQSHELSSSLQEEPTPIPEQSQSIQKEPSPIPETSQSIQEEPSPIPETSQSIQEPSPIPEPNQSKKAKHVKRHLGPNTSQREEDEYHRYHRDTDYPSPRSRGSFVITKKLKDAGKTRSTIHKESLHAGRPDLDSLITNRRTVSTDPIQTTLDMEHLRFTCKLKDVLRKSSTDVHVSEPPFQTMFESKRIPGSSRSRPKGRSPLFITVHCTPQQQRRKDYRGHASSSYSQVYYEEDPREKPAYYSRTPKKARSQRFSPLYHFSRLRYESSPEKPNSDISVILKECAQSNHQRLSRLGLGSTAVERTLAGPVPEETDRQMRQTLAGPASTKSRTVGTIITDLCTNLRSKLHSVARESAQKNCYFYLCKTNDDQDDAGGDEDFFTLTKSLLIKDGYTPIEPQDFCEIEQAESSTLLVIIRNEDVSSRIHKIPHLLQLRLLPNVRFAGVDAPEDLSESMHQELFQTGGLVVSDKAVLENISIGKLKEILIILEKMNRISAWKWLIHYGEYRKLKEDKRAESVSRTKIPLLKSYQQSNVIEILPYHRCDSKSTGVSSDLECLLSLQSQHIRSRLTVWLTVTSSTEEEEMAQNGIVVYDVDNFIRRIQKVDAQLQHWS